MPIAVTLSLSRDEVGAVEYGATRIVGPRAAMVIVDTDSGEAELELRLDDAADIESARAQGVALWEEIRNAGSLSPAPAVVTGVFRFSESVDRASEFIDDAEEMFDQHRYELAIVAAQTACEVVARSAVDRLHEGPRQDRFAISPRRFRRWSLRDPAGQLLFHAATGMRIQRDFLKWGDYNAHVERRNNVVHQGAQVTRDDAKSSLDAMWAFIEFVRAAEAAQTAPT